MGRDYLRRGHGLLELPVSVTPRLRLPFIGTFLSMFGPDGARLLAKRMRREPVVNLELHGIDALDESDGLSALASVQPDLHIPHQRKLETYSAAVESLRREGFATLTLREVSRRYPR
jgi:hypothetical protein